VLDDRGEAILTVANLDVPFPVKNGNCGLPATAAGQALSASAISFWRSITGGRWFVADWPATERISAVVSTSQHNTRREN
jgi:hypothetical protein